MLILHLNQNDRSELNKETAGKRRSNSSNLNPFPFDIWSSCDCKGNFRYHVTSIILVVCMFGLYKLYKRLSKYTIPLSRSWFYGIYNRQFQTFSGHQILKKARNSTALFWCCNSNTMDPYTEVSTFNLNHCCLMD